MLETRNCPRCGKDYSDDPAISRREPHEEICPDCGILEALRDSGISDEGKQQDILAAAHKATVNRP